jgi:DNA-binding CsgD family transcriptional regulator
VLYVRELLLGALADGSLVEEGGLWRMPRRPAPSDSLIEMISSRLAELGEDERRTAELLALGEPLPLSELVELVGTAAVEKAESRAIAVVTPQPPHEVRAAHPLFSEVMRAQVPVVRAHSTRVRLASVLQRRERHTPDDALRIARLLLDAGEAIPRDVLIEAAGAANVSGDPDLGAMLAARAIAEGAGWQAAAVLARAHFVRKRFEEAEIVLAGQEVAIDSPDDALEYLEQRVPLLYWGLKRPADALAVLDRAAAWWPGEAWARRLLPLRLHVVAFTGDFAAALPAGEELLGDDGLAPETRALLAPIQTTNLFYSGRGREAAALARAIRRSPPLRDQTDALAFMVAANMNVETGIGWDDLQPWLERSVVSAVRYEDEEAAGVAALALGCIASLRARYADAARWLVEATVHFERSDVFGATVVARGALVGVALATGDADRAAREHRLCREALGGHDPLPNQRPWVVRADGWAAAAQGDRPRAVARFLEGAAEHGPMPLLATQLFHEALLLGAPARSIAATLDELRPRVDAPLGTAFADHARALADGDGQALLECADAFAAIGARRHESACAADAARVFLAAGRSDSARRAAARSRDALPAGQGAVAPEIDGLDSAAVDLTARERQLVDYAARGLTNAEIADRLVLSVRTVETHLYRAMHKLGVSDRRELRERRTS